MITRLYSAALRGVDAREVEVEVNVRNSEKPLVIVVGCRLWFDSHLVLQSQLNDD